MDYEILFPVGYKQDYRELMAYIDSQFEKIENENNIKYGELLEGCVADTEGAKHTREAMLCIAELLFD